MKIPESIIEKYKLTGSTAQVGEAFINNLMLFDSGLPGFEGVIFMECDLLGGRSDFVHIYNKHSKMEASATPDWLIDVLPDTVLRIVSVRSP
jgi:hypothetical protein